MKNTIATTTRTATLSRLALALVVALVLGAMVVPSVEAAKAGKNTISSIKSRILTQVELCETIGGGTLTVKDSPFVPNQITTCNGGAGDGKTCTHTPKKTICSQALTAHEDVSAPPGETVVLEEPAGGANAVASPPGGQVAAQGEEGRQNDGQGKGRKKAGM